MRSTITVAVFVSVLALASAQKCMFKDRGFKQCVANYSNWVQVQLSQIKDLSAMMISKIPEPPKKKAATATSHGEGFHASQALHAHRANHHHLSKRDAADESADEEDTSKRVASSSEERQDIGQVGNDEVEAMSWTQFKTQLIKIIKTVIDNGGAELTDGVRTLEHSGGVYDVRSIVCIYASVGAINPRGGAAIEALLKKLPAEKRQRYQVAVALPVWITAAKIGDIKKNMEKQVSECYFLLV